MTHVELGQAFGGDGQVERDVDAPQEAERGEVYLALMDRKGEVGDDATVKGSDGKTQDDRQTAVADMWNGRRKGEYVVAMGRRDGHQACA